VLAGREPGRKARSAVYWEEYAVDVFDLIKSEHRKVKELMARMSETSSRGAKLRSSGVSRLKDMLLPHMHAEEELFYPFVMNETDGRLDALEGYEEHKAARMVLEDLENTAVDDERWPANLKVLKDLIEHHVKEEEGPIFKAARPAAKGERGREMAREFKNMESEAKAGMAV